MIIIKGLFQTSINFLFLFFFRGEINLVLVFLLRCKMEKFKMKEMYANFIDVFKVYFERKKKIDQI